MTLGMTNMKKYNQNMTIKEHINLSESECLQNNAYSNAGLPIRNLDKTVYRLVALIKELEKEIK